MNREYRDDNAGWTALTLRGLAWGAVAQYKAAQKPEELELLLHLVVERRLNTVLEIGCGAGGTLWAWRALGLDVYAIDLPRGPFGGQLGGPTTHGAAVFLGSSRSEDLRDEVHTAIGTKPLDLLFIDGDHRYDGVKSDYFDFVPWVRAGGLVVLHDICDHLWQPAVGVRRFWRELRDEWPSGTYREIVAGDTTWGGIGVIEL